MHIISKVHFEAVNLRKEERVGDDISSYGKRGARDKKKLQTTVSGE